MALPLKVTTSSLQVGGGLRPMGLSTASGLARSLITTSVAATSSVSGSAEPALPSGLSTFYSFRFAQYIGDKLGFFTACVRDGFF